MSLFNLERFISAQENNNMYERSLQEVKDGEKQSHWIWYIFPQIEGLGRSSNSKYYSIKSLLEAKAYTENLTLDQRLREITEAFLYGGNSAEFVFGSLDAKKVQSCMTLFDIVSHNDIYGRVIEEFYDGKKCQQTLNIIKNEKELLTGDSILEKNGIYAPSKAFFEGGTTESESIKEEKRLATMVDLMCKGNKMEDMVSQYLWEKDFSDYRLSGVESTIGYLPFSIIGALEGLTKDEQLQNYLGSLVASLRDNPHDNVFSVAKRMDNVFTEMLSDERIKPLLTALSKGSLCK